MIDTYALAGKLVEFNRSETSYSVLKELFDPFSNNLDLSEMELFAYAIEAVYNEIQNFKKIKNLRIGAIHILGLNDSHAFGLFNKLCGTNTVRDKLMQTIGFEEGDVEALKEMLIQIQENQLRLMKLDMGKEL